MDNEPSDSKEPQDSIRPKQSSIEEEQPKDNEYDINNQEMSEKIGEEMKDIKSEENEKITNEHIVDEELIESSKELKNFYSDLETILININNIWNYNREGYVNHYITEIKPKINELLTYPCITSFQDKVILISLIGHGSSFGMHIKFPKVSSIQHDLYISSHCLPECFKRDS